MHALNHSSNEAMSIYPNMNPSSPFDDTLRRSAPTHRQYFNAYHLHVVHIGSEFWKRHLLFRDYLRVHQDIARQYEQMKKDLAKRFSDTNEYADAKTDFIESIIAKAKTQWRLEDL